MPSPITEDDIADYNPQADVCDKLEQLFRTSNDFKTLLGYLFNSDGSVSDDFASDINSALRTLIGVPSGAVLFMPVQTIPAGYVLANGQSISRTTYADLFAVYGTTYGSDSTTTFKVPNLYDRFLLGGGSSYLVGATGGESTHVLTPAEGSIQGHTHVFGNVDNPAQDDARFLMADSKITIPSQNSHFIAGDVDSGVYNNITEGDYQTAGPVGYEDSDDESAAHNNMPPYFAGLWLVKT